MRHDTRFGFRALTTAFAVFVGMMAFMELGRQVGLHELAANGSASRAAIGIIDGAVFGLVSLLLGFSFNGAAARFDSRRSIVSNEVNAIGTAWQRIDLLPDALQGTVRASFRRYIDALIASYAAHDVDDPLGSPVAVAKAEATLWTETVTACLHERGEKARVLLIPTVNEMLGAVEKERLARRIHPPVAIYAMLVFMTLAASLFAGYSMANVAERNWLHVIGVPIAITVTLYVVLDLEYPRRGFITMRAMDETLAELRAGMR